MKKIGVIGCGTIGTQVCLAIDQGKIQVELIGVSEIDESKANQLLARLRRPCQILSVSDLVSQADLIVEAAGQAIVSALIDPILEQGKDLMVMSVGGLLEIDSLRERFRDSGSHLYIPSGAIAGLDAVRAACMAAVQSITLTTRKPPQGLKGAPYCLERGIDLDHLTKESTIFEGTAREAARAFPKNINVAAALSLAGIGPDKTRVKIIADPEITINIHEIEVIGESGRIITRTENLPFDLNPKTSYLAALSCLATLKDIL